MPSRLQKPRPPPTHSRESPVRTQQDIENEPAYLYAAASDASPRTKPAHTPYSVKNIMNTYSATPESKYNPYASPNFSSNGNGKVPSTIRTVPSFETPSDVSSLDSPYARNSGFSSSVNSNVSGTSYHSQQQTYSSSTVRLKPQSPGLSPPLPVSRGGSSYTSTSDATNGEEEMADEPTLSLQVPDSSILDDRSNRAPETSPQWDGAVGKAGLGKTGRVINKLVSDNEALKRDIQIERLKAEEARQAAKLIEDKMERMVADYESRLLEANVTKTLLSRKERQVEHLQSTVELEKKRTADAQERERTWREEMEKSRRDTKIQVEEATIHAALMDGRYNAISSHWKDQGDEVKRAMAGIDDKIKALAQERRTDDEKINVLRDLCDQQDGNIRDLQRQKDEIAQQFEAYKREQEQSLKDIKKAAHGREDEQERSLEEAKRVLGQLKWALNVKQNVKGAQ